MKGADKTVGVLMIACSVVMFEFLYRTRRLPKLEEPHEMPLPALVGAVALTLGIALGYLYFIVFNYAFETCDKLVDISRAHELALESIYDVIMSYFAVISLVYILQRRYYGAINSSLDKVGRLFINLTFVVVWVKVVLYKGYLSNQELCQRKELEGYWCPAMKKVYSCDPSNDLHGTQKMWYYINKGLLSSSIISCASEFFPVILIAHWLACGGAEERAEKVKLRQEKRQGLRGLMKRFVQDASRVYVAEYNLQAPAYVVKKWIIWFFWIAVPPTCAVSLARWLSFFYYSMDLDELVEEQWDVADIMALITASMQIAFYGVLVYFAHTFDNERLDAHHKAESRGDIGILFGCCVVLLVKFILQTIELVYQGIDGFLDNDVVGMRIATLFLTHSSQWMGYLALRRLLALSMNDLKACKRFLSIACVGGTFFSWIHFGCTFLDTTNIKYELTDETFRFSSVTLASMIFTQTMFPAEYLYAFTAAGCYLEIVQRYANIGYFQVGRPRLNIEEENRRFAAGQHLATLFERARIMERKRQESTLSGASSVKSNGYHHLLPIQESSES